MSSLVDYYNEYLLNKEIKEYVDKYMKTHGILNEEDALKYKVVQVYIDEKKGCK